MQGHRSNELDLFSSISISLHSHAADGSPRKSALRNKTNRSNMNIDLIQDDKSYGTYFKKLSLKKMKNNLRKKNKQTMTKPKSLYSITNQLLEAKLREQEYQK